VNEAKASLGPALRIAWASPLNQASAIGRVSVDVAEALVGRGHGVRLIATEHADFANRPRHPTTVRSEHWSQVDLAALADDFDIVVVNVGDHFGFHAGIFPLMESAGCLGVFHDFYLFNLFQGWLQDCGRSRTETWRQAKRVSEITSVYGQPLGALAAGVEAALLDTIAARIPMTEWVARRCSGVLAHARFYQDRLIAACPGPTAAGPLPVSGRGIPPLEPRAEERITLLTVGHMNANKCVAEAIAAIAASPRLAKRVDYRLVGPIDPAEAERLRTMAQGLGYGGLSIIGPVDEASLNRSLEDADIICCLRRPVLEGASGSAVEGLLAGRPVIVADAGFYAELPDEVVFKVPADIDLGALTGQLERLCADEVLRRTAGAKARAWAEGHFNIGAYLEVLEPLMWATIAAQPVLGVGRGLGAELARLGLGEGDVAVRRVDDALTGLFAAKP
jgi:glycosyltransferase involved in cell wall biosynthesis